MRRISQKSLNLGTSRGLTAFALLLAGLSTANCGKDKAKTTAPTEVDEAAKKKQVAEQKAKGLIEVANKDLESGRYNSARKRAEQALAENPKNVDAHSVLGAASWRGGEFEASLEAYQNAIEIEPTNFGAVIGLAQALQATGRHTETIEALDALLEHEGDGFKETKCDEEGQCSEGYCDTNTNMCKADMQVRPRISKLLSQYLLLDAAGASKTADEIFVGVGGEEAHLEVARSLASFVRPLEGKGPFVEVEGTEGSVQLDANAALALKFASIQAGGKRTVAVISEMQDECRIDAAFAERLGLEEIAKANPYGAEEMGIVVVPELKFGDLTVRNVPALVQDLSIYADIGDTPGLIVGRQVLHKLGAVTYDFPNNTLTAYAEKLSGAPEGSHEVPLLMMEMISNRIPVVKMSVDGGHHPFWAWFGGPYASGITVTAKEYLRAKHRPDDIAEPEDPDAGLKMVYVRKLNLGGLESSGVGGIVLTNTPPDEGLNGVVQMTSFELGGYLNMTLLKQWKVTYSLQDGKVYLAAPAAAAP